MTATPAAKGTVRLGIVPYLNVQPLIWAFTDSATERVTTKAELVPALPSELARRLRAGEYAAAIVPVFEYLQNPIYTIVPDVAIAADGPVRSVALFSQCPLEEIETVELDPASLTSVNLLRVLLAERRLSVRFNVHENSARRSGRLIIGDPALAAATAGSSPYVYDLAGMWKELTGLPFVFAAWLVHPNSQDFPLNSALLEAKNLGLANLERVSAETAERFGSTPQAALAYFRENLDYDLAEREIAGWRHFGQLCAKHGLLNESPPLKFHRL